MESEAVFSSGGDDGEVVHLHDEEDEDANADDANADWYSDVASLKSRNPLRNFLRENRINLADLWAFTSLIVLYALFLMLVATARGRRVSTLALGSLYFLTLYAFVFGLGDSHWYVAHKAEFVSSYCAYANRSLVVAKADLKVAVGLRSFNVTYTRSEQDQGFSYNEYFEFEPSRSLKLDALRRGLPNPVIATVEYFSVENKVGKFGFARKFGSVGWYVHALLSGSFAVFVMGSAALLGLPKQLPLMAFVNSLSLVGTAGLYYRNCGCGDSATIYVEGVPIAFGPGRTFFLVVLAGALNLVAAILIPVLVRFTEISGPVSTFLEINYETPWCAQRLKEDSRRRCIEETTGNGNGRAGNLFRASVRKLRNSFRPFKIGAATAAAMEETAESKHGGIEEMEEEAFGGFSREVETRQRDSCRYSTLPKRATTTFDATANGTNNNHLSTYSLGNDNRQDMRGRPR